jgi:glycosyltransferase involved in cell wall biosynthesis
MRIGVNLIPLRPGQMGGAEVYLRDLLAELLRRGEHEYVLVTADYNHETLPPDSPACRRVLFAHGPGPEPARWRMGRVVGHLRQRLNQWRRSYQRLLPVDVQRVLSPLVQPVLRGLDRAIGWLRTRRHRPVAEGLRELIRRERLDVWFCPFTNLDPRICPVPAVITVFDLQHEYYPEFFDPAELRHRRHFYPESCMAADHIIAISEFTRRCVIERYGVNPARVSALWLAPGSDFEWHGAAAGVAAVRDKYALPSRYVLYPANTWHHKNHLRLVEALALYRASHGEELTLVLTGVGKEGQAGLEDAVERHKLEGLVRILGYVPRADLPALYAGAACLVLPSLFEGFGIPLVEAMLVGCPIAAAEGSSIPEVVGDAGVLFDPLDPADISRALAAVVRDPAMAAELRRRGRARAELFSVSRMAESTLRLFERIAREHSTSDVRAGREMIAAEGVYDDRWMGVEATFLFVGASFVSAEVEGYLPRLAPIVPQKLAVRVGQQEAVVYALGGPGPFTLSVPLEPNGAGEGEWEVSLVPSQTFCPMAHGISADHRELSVQLLRVRARTHDGREIAKTLGAPDQDAC